MPPRQSKAKTMPEGGEVLTPVPTELALRQAEINATRTLTESVNRLTERMDGFGNSLGEIKDKVTTIEARNFDNQILKLETDTREAVKILHDSNKTRDERIRGLETQIARFGAFLAVAGAVGGAALGVMATKVFGG